MSERRFVRTLATNQFLELLLKRGMEPGVAPKSGIPETAKFKFSFTYPEIGGACFVFEDESFDPIPLGREFPIIQPIFQRGTDIAMDQFKAVIEFLVESGVKKDALWMILEACIERAEKRMGGER